MDESLRSGNTPCSRIAAIRVARVAAGQGGHISRAQLLQAGATSMQICRWVRGARLELVYPGVFAVGYRNREIDGRLWAALLYAGPGAALSHATAAWWWDLFDAAPRRIHVNTARRRAGIDGALLHTRSSVAKVVHRGLPVTPVAQTLLDVAASHSFADTRRALAEADYRGLLALDAAAGVLGRGRRGSANLAAALRDHMPQLAHTRSVLEERFLDLCERYALPVPELNVEVAGLTVDALWREARLVVELDGAAHATYRALQADRARDLRLRRAGHAVLRYSWRQVVEEGEAVGEDLQAALAAPGSDASWGREGCASTPSRRFLKRFAANTTHARPRILLRSADQAG